MFILEPNEITRALSRKKVTVYDFPDGRIEVRHQGQALPYRTFDRMTLSTASGHRATSRTCSTTPTRRPARVIFFEVFPKVPFDASPDG